MRKSRFSPLVLCYSPGRVVRCVAICTNAERIAGAVAAWLLAREAGVLAQQVGLGFAQQAAGMAAGAGQAVVEGDCAVRLRVV